MKREKNKICLVCVLFSSFIVNSQIPTTCKYNEQLISASVEIDLICGYKKNKLNYDEGVFLTFSYADSTVIVIFDGVMTRIPLLSIEDNYIPLKFDTVQNKISTTGIKENYHWREDRITERLRILYMNVTDDKKNFYDNVLNSLKIYE